MYQSRCLTILLCWTICRSYSQPFDVKMNSNDTNKTRIFSPRMDYDEWTPLGRGDPLKNDPTFDYVPPVLDRVQYWLDTQSSTEASSKRDILILGVTAKKTSPKIPDHYMKFGDSQKLTRIQESQDNYRNDFTGSTGAEPPKLVRATKFRPNLNGNSIDFRSQNRMQSLPASYYPSPYYTDKPKPYTMMMPPPITHKSKINQQFGSLNDQVTVAFRPGHLRIPQKNPLSTSIAFDKSNLIYQSSQTIDPWTANLDSSSSINTWMSNEKFDDHYDHHASASSNHQVIVGQNANIIVDDSQKNEQVVVGKKEIVPTDDSNILFDNKTVTPAHVIMANTSSTSNDDQRVTVTVVMPTNYKPNNTEKTNIETSTVSFTTTPTLPTTTPTTSTPIQSTRIPWRPPKIPPKAFPRRPGLSEISKPPQIIANQDNMSQMPLQKLPSVLMQAPNSVITGSMFSSDIKKPPGKSPLASILNSQYNSNIPSKIEIPKSTTEWLTSTTESLITTSTSEYTSDSVSLDDKQQPVVTTIHKPMYLIIQGHSKVKTYKPTVMKHSLPVDDNNNNKIVESTMRKRMTTTTSRSISKFEQFVNDNTRVAPTTLPPNTDCNHEVKAAKEKRVEHDSLLSFVESGFSALTAPPLTFDSSTIDQDNSDSTYNDDDDDLMIN